MPSPTLSLRRTPPPHATGLAALAVALLLAPIAGLAATPTTLQLEGALLAAAGAPAADGDYALGFALYASEGAKAPAWAEGPVQVKVAGGRFSATLGASKALDGALLAGLAEAWLGVQVGADPELPRRRLHAAPFALVAGALGCTGCVQGDQLANGGIPAAKIGFSYAASASKGGPASDLACTGCVSVSELAFDGDVDLGGHALKGASATFSGDVVAKTVTATAFVGDGSKLSGVKMPAGQCPAGQAMVGVAADGALICKSLAAALPPDGIAAVSGGLLSNQFTDKASAPAANVAIPDATGKDATSVIQFPDLGVAQALSVAIELVNTDLSNVRVRLLPPNDKKTGYTLCDPCGDKDAKSLKASWTDQQPPKTGKLSDWLGSNPKGDWTLVVTDAAFCAKGAPGNAELCDVDNKLDGAIVTWSVEVKTLSTKKVSATSALQLLPATKPPFDCTANHMGAMYFDQASRSLRYCDGEVWRTLADTCGNGVLEPNEDCDDGNNSDGDGCSKTCETVCGDGKVVGKESCDDGNKIDGDGCSKTCETVCGDGKVVGKESCDDGNKVDGDACTNACQPGYGAHKDAPASSCLDLLTKYKAAGGAAADGSYWIKAPKAQVLQVQCDMTSEGGGYTYFAVASGKTTSRSTDDNSCKDYGLDIVYPRSKAQWAWMLSKFGASYFATIPGVTKSGNGGNYTGCVMRHPGSYGSGCNDWRVPDGGRRWLRDGTYGEPNGDYTANCWLSMYKHDPNDIQFNDGNCSYSTSKYLCSTNDKK
jgi:cysteine-rich repeat protein